MSTATATTPPFPSNPTPDPRRRTYTRSDTLSPGDHHMLPTADGPGVEVTVASLLP